MSEPHVQEELLNRYFDGELAASDAASVRGHLASCAHCTARHGELDALRRMITIAAEESSAAVDFDRAFARIEREVRAAPEAEIEAGLLERMLGWLRTTLEQRPEQIWAPALGVAAGAALLFVLARGTPATEVATQPTPAPESAVAEAPGPAETAGGAGAEPGLPEGALAMASSEVVQVDFGSQTGTVFEVTVADGVSTPVVWINDD